MTDFIAKLKRLRALNSASEICCFVSHYKFVEYVFVDTSVINWMYLQGIERYAVVAAMVRKYITKKNSLLNNFGVYFVIQAVP